MEEWQKPQDMRRAQVRLVQIGMWDLQFRFKMMYHCTAQVDNPKRMTFNKQAHRTAFYRPALRP